MRHIYRVFQYAFLCLSFVYGTNAYADSTIKGKVLDEKGVALFNASITIEGTALGASSRSDGTFTISSVSAGTCTLQASHIRFEPVKAEVTVTENEEKVIVLQFQRERELSLDEITVTATRSELRTEEVPQPVAQISADEVGRRYQYNVGEMLDLVPGVRIVRAGGTIGADYGLSIRSLNGGPSSDKTLVLVDGRPINDGWSGGLDFNMLPSEIVERVEIVKGSSSALYGSQATAGVINVITRKPELGWHAWASVAREFNDAKKITDKLADGYGRPDVSATNFQFNGSYSNEETSHLFTVGYRQSDQSFFGKTVENDWDNNDLNYKVDHRFSEKLLGAVHVDWHQNSWKKEADRTPTDQDYRFLSGDVSMKYLSGVGTYNARIYINNADYEEKALQTQVKTGHNAYRYGFIGDYSMPLFDSHALLKVGVDGYIDNADVDDQKTVMDLKFDKIGTYKGKQVELYTGVYGANSNSYDLSNIALFAQYEHKFMDRLNVVVGGRIDRHSEFGTVFNPKAGATYELLNFDGITTNLKANYGKGFRAPTIVGLFSKTLGGYGNPDLKPEKTENFDIGIFQRFADWGYLEVSYFRMNVTNLIINDKVGSTGNGYYVVVPKTSGSGNDTLSFNYRRNLGSYSPSGVEIGLKVRPIKQLTLGGSYTYLDPEDFTFQTSRHRYNFSIYGWQDVLGVRVEGELIYNYTGDGYFFDFEKSPYEAFSTVDLMLAANFMENYRVSFIAKNIADTEYKLWNYEWQPGRTLTVRLEARF